MFHHYIQVDLVIRIPIGVEIMLHFNAEGMLQYLEYLQLSVFISFVLVHFFDGYCFTVDPKSV